jgi:AraC-like DNA-binding protein
VTYRELRPTAALQPWVECYWTRGEDDGACTPNRILPDGCADLVFDLTHDDAFAVGTMTTALVLPPSPGQRFFGVRFRPGRAAAFLRIPLAEITDARVPLRELWKQAPRLAGVLLTRADGEGPSRAHVANIEQELLRRLDPDRDARVDAAIARIITSDGAARIETLAHDLAISRQHLARQFLHHVGVAPKTFARVMRFRRVMSTARADADWADVAARHGYYDQSHLIAEFRALAGTTPNAFHFSNP